MKQQNHKENTGFTDLVSQYNGPFDKHNFIKNTIMMMQLWYF